MGVKKSGWSNEESELLFGLAERAKREGGSLCGVFAEVASLTGRRPDSVRNRYYALLGEMGIPSSRYVPFSGEASRKLVFDMLTLISKGYSVRKAAMELAGGDISLMLRYQNKFRSLVSRSPGFVEEVAKEHSLSPALARSGMRSSGKASENRALRAQLESKSRELTLQRERIMLLQTMFRKLCELDGELALKASPQAELFDAPEAAESK